MGLRENLDSITEELSKRHRNPTQLMVYFINKRLNDSLKSYYKELSESAKYLSDRKDDVNIIKRLNDE